MKRLLRGIIDFGSIPYERMLENYLRLSDTKIQWVDPEDEKIFKFVRGFYDKELAFPSADLLADTYAEDVGAYERLKDIKTARNHHGANYARVLSDVLEDQRRLQFHSLLKQAADISQKGITVEEGRKKKQLKGVEDALRYLGDGLDSVWEAGRITRPVLVTDLRQASDLTWVEYNEAEANPSKAWGVLSGFEPIDTICHGIKPGEIWVHAAYTGGLKSTLAQNVAWTTMTKYRKNVVYVSLEATIEQFRRTIHVLHSTRPEAPGPVLDYRQVRDGELPAEKKQGLREVLDDFKTNPDYAWFKAITVTEPLGVPALRRELEKIHREMEIGLVVIDYSELLEPPRRDQNHGVAMNSIYHALRELSLQFDRGNGLLGLPLMVLHQTNRDGFERAVKAGGRYSSATALSWANEAERSASLVTWSFVDEGLSAVNKVRVGCLKNRDNPHFREFELDVHWPTKRLSYESVETEYTDSGEWNI